MNIRKKWILINVGLLATFISAQNVTIEGTFNRFITYSIRSVDINTGGSKVQLFIGRLSSDSYPVTVKINFSIQIKSPALGIPDNTTLIEVETDTFEMVADIQLDNRDLSTDNLVIYDVLGNEVDVSPIEVISSLDISDFEDMFGVIVQTSRLPDGVYTFKFSVLSPEGVLLDVEEEIINVTTPTTLQLTSPGGQSIDNLEQNEIYTPYPVFQWESETFSPGVIDYCDNCGFFVRIAEFHCPESLVEAIEGTTVYPLVQAKGWLLIGDLNGDNLWQSSEVTGSQLTFDYPSGAVDLIPGSIYVWQIQKRISTTAGIKEINSPIYVFQFKDLSTNPVMQALQQILPEEIFNNFFKPCGPLTGYSSNGLFKIDGIEGDISTLNALMEEFNQGTRTLITTEVR